MSQWTVDDTDFKQVENTSRQSRQKKDLDTHSSGLVDQRDQMLQHKKCKEFHNLSHRQEEPVRWGQAQTGQFPDMALLEKICMCRSSLVRDDFLYSSVVGDN